MKLQKVVIQWGRNNSLAPELTAALFTGLSQWRGSFAIAISTLQVAPPILEAFHAQASLGWGAAFKGFLVPEW
eukprot:6893612-Ditylum_brightwellii.AAC.1